MQQQQTENDVQSPNLGKEDQSPAKEDQSPVKEIENLGQKSLIKSMETFQNVFKITIPYKTQMPLQLMAIVLLIATYFINLYSFSNSDEGDCKVTFIGVKVCILGTQEEKIQTLSQSSIVDCDGKAENLCTLCILLPYLNALIILLIFLSLLNRIWALNGESIFDWTLVESIIVLIFQLIIIILLKAFSIDEYSVGDACYALECISCVPILASTLLDIRLRNELNTINTTEQRKQGQ